MPRLTRPLRAMLLKAAEAFDPGPLRAKEKRDLASGIAWLKAKQQNGSDEHEVPLETATDHGQA